eukprot:TRINITY_DN1919_c0_g1_i1.p1 TRINITY_DN1919_c0_g1~~TRINITY_DN1919_c0_g1_i1.p1  ORF type:complete len:153 (-),score=25.88 TRINITY_DN1919_c0_g1_i1:531-989(-)
MASLQMNIKTPKINLIKRRLRAASYTHQGCDVRTLFYFSDGNRANSARGGTLDLREFTRCLRCAKITPAQMSDKDIKWLFRVVDTDKSGELDIEEFVEFVGQAPKYENKKDALDRQYREYLEEAANHAMSGQAERPIKSREIRHSAMALTKQ